MMKEKSADPLTAGKIAESLGVSAGKVKKAIEELKIKPTTVKGPCAYYDHAAVEMIRAALK